MKNTSFNLRPISQQALIPNNQLYYSEGNGMLHFTFRLTEDRYFFIPNQVSEYDDRLIQVNPNHADFMVYCAASNFVIEAHNELQHCSDLGKITTMLKTTEWEGIPPGYTVTKHSGTTIKIEVPKSEEEVTPKLQNKENAIKRLFLFDIHTMTLDNGKKVLDVLLNAVRCDNDYLESWNQYYFSRCFDISGMLTSNWKDILIRFSDEQKHILDSKQF